MNPPTNLDVSSFDVSQGLECYLCDEKKPCVAIYKDCSHDDRHEADGTVEILACADCLRALATRIDKKESP
jgi:hypothetical protein